MSEQNTTGASALALDPHVMMSKIMDNLEIIASGITELNDNIAVITDILEAADGSLAENSESDKRFTPASFLRSYRKIREEQESDGEEDDPEEIDNPVADLFSIS